ncbi:MAG: hypothetical protein N3D11_03780 [Candidatus Sumerlaeia bacterium]|nr:hypothetical protein [Candidatus Sumerlaeia bacterium]
MAVEKSLDRKLAEIRANYNTRTFILADAKDPDIAYGMKAPGRSPEYYGDEVKYRSLAEFRQCIRDVVRQAEVDIVLMTASTSEILVHEERLFDHSPVTPACRTNDTTDIHIARGSNYAIQASRPWRTPTLDHAICAKLECTPEEAARGVNLGLYSITFNNDAELDRATLQAFKEFRIEAERKKFRYFLEVFDPNVPGAIDPDMVGPFINDMIARTLAGVTKAAKPLFLKMVYHGPKWMEELVHYDPDLIPGVLGGASGTTYDAFKLLAEAQKYGARVALFGRKINNSENQLAFIKFLRMIADGVISPEEAVKAYHGVLQELKIRPYRTLEEDSQLTTPIMSYGSSTVSMPATTKPAATTFAANADILMSPRQAATAPAPQPAAASATPPAASASAVPRAVPAPAAIPAPPSRPAAAKPVVPDIDIPRLPDGSPDFDRMTPDQKLAWNKQERDRIFGW